MPVATLLVLCLLVTVDGWSQGRYLALNKPGRVKRLRFYVGDEIAVKLKNDKRIYRDVLAGVRDSSIVLMGAVVPIRDIRAVIVEKDGGLLPAIVYVLPRAGILYFLAATFNPVFQGERLTWNRSGIVVGSTLVGSSFLLRPLLKRTYRINANRRLQILQTY